MMRLPLWVYPSAAGAGFLLARTLRGDGAPPPSPTVEAAPAEPDPLAGGGDIGGQFAWSGGGNLGGWTGSDAWPAYPGDSPTLPPPGGSGSDPLAGGDAAAPVTAPTPGPSPTGDESAPRSGGLLSSLVGMFNRSAETPGTPQYDALGAPDAKYIPPGIGQGGEPLPGFTPNEARAWWANWFANPFDLRLVDPAALPGSLVLTREEAERAKALNRTTLPPPPTGTPPNPNLSPGSSTLAAIIGQQQAGNPNYPRFSTPPPGSPSTEPPPAPTAARPLTLAQYDARYRQGVIDRARATGHTPNTDDVNATIRRNYAAYLASFGG